MNPRALASTAALLAAVALAPACVAADAPTMPHPASETRITTVAVPPRPSGDMSLAADLSWRYRGDIETDGQHAVGRMEVTTVYKSWDDRWVTAVRWLDAAMQVGTRVPPAYVRGFLDGHGCLVDTQRLERLQAEPCVTSTAIADGDTWTIQWPAGGQRREFRATGRESISVPAGTFQALRVEETDLAELVVDGGTRAMRPTFRTVYWHASQVAATVRVERETLRPDGSVASREVQVLESFGPASEETRTAVHATREWQHWQQLQATHARIEAVVAATPPLRQEAEMDPMSPSCRPEYPAAALRAQATGQTRIRVVVNANGALSDSEITGSSGPTREHRLLDVTAQSSLIKCPVRPALAKDGTPVTSVIEMSYRWRLD